MKEKKLKKVEREELLKVIAQEFVDLFEQEWARQLPVPPHDKRELMSGWVKPEGFADAMAVFFTGMCYKAQEEALKKLFIKFKAMRDL